MRILLIVLLILSVVFFVWQGALFIRDLIKHHKEKKLKKESENKESDRKE